MFQERILHFHNALRTDKRLARDLPHQCELVIDVINQIKGLPGTLQGAIERLDAQEVRKTIAAAKEGYEKCIASIFVITGEELEILHRENKEVKKEKDLINVALSVLAEVQSKSQDASDKKLAYDAHAKIKALADTVASIENELQELLRNIYRVANTERRNNETMRTMMTIINDNSLMAHVVEVKKLVDRESKDLHKNVKLLRQDIQAITQIKATHKIGQNQRKHIESIVNGHSHVAEGLAEEQKNLHELYSQFELLIKWSVHHHFIIENQLKGFQAAVQRDLTAHFYPKKDLKEHLDVLDGIVKKMMTAARKARVLTRDEKGAEK